MFKAFGSPEQWYAPQSERVCIAVRDRVLTAEDARMEYWPQKLWSALMHWRISVTLVFFVQRAGIPVGI